MRAHMQLCVCVCVCVCVCMHVSFFRPGLPSPHSSVGKSSARNAGDPSLIPELGRSPGEGSGNLLQYSCLKEAHGQRSLAGLQFTGSQESDRTWRPNHPFTLTLFFLYGTCIFLQELIFVLSYFYCLLIISIENAYARVKLLLDINKPELVLQQTTCPLGLGLKVPMAFGN